MAKSTPNQTAQSGNIHKLEIFSNKNGKSADIGPGVVVCDYYESILDSSVRFSIIVADSGHSDAGGEATTVLHELKLSGSEKVHLTIEDNLGNKLKFADDNALYISEIRNILSSSENTIYQLDLCSLEIIANDFSATTVYRRFNGEISQSAEIIFKDILKTRKSVILDATANTFNFNGQGKKPFRLLAEIATKGVSQASKNSAGYLVYETYEGFNFRSIDGLFDDVGDYKSFIYNSSTDLPTGYDAKILDYVAENTINVKKNLESGGYGSKLETFDTYSHIFNTKAQEIDTEEQKVHGGIEVPKLAKDFLELFGVDGGLVSRTFSKIDSKGELPDGGITEQVEKATESNLTLEDVIVQSSMSYNKLFTLNIEITIPGDYSLRAGQIVYCDIPEQSSKKEGTPDQELSGLYIISDVCTHLTPRNTYTKMHLIRDSYGRQPNKSSSSTPTGNRATGLTGNTGRALPGTGSVNPFSQSEIERYVQEEKDLVSRLNTPSSDDSQTIDRTRYSNTDVDLDAGYDDPNFNPDDYLELY